jgi:hypothetical protein
MVVKKLSVIKIESIVYGLPSVPEEPWKAIPWTRIDFYSSCFTYISRD